MENYLIRNLERFIRSVKSQEPFREEKEYGESDYFQLKCDFERLQYQKNLLSLLEEVRELITKNKFYSDAAKLEVQQKVIPPLIEAYKAFKVCVDMDSNY